MDRFSFLNAAHTEFFAQLYDQYLENPDSVEPSWRSFFQGFDFGLSSSNGEIFTDEALSISSEGQDFSTISAKLQKEVIFVPRILRKIFCLNPGFELIQAILLLWAHISNIPKRRDKKK